MGRLLSRSLRPAACRAHFSRSSSAAAANACQCMHALMTLLFAVISSTALSCQVHGIQAGKLAPFMTPYLQYHRQPAPHKVKGQLVKPLVVDSLALQPGRLACTASEEQKSSGTTS